MVYALLDGFMCRLLLYSSVAYNDTNQITLEFSTPRSVAPTSMLLCANNTDTFSVDVDNVTSAASKFSVVSLVEGGSLFNTTGAAEQLSGQQPWFTEIFFRQPSSGAVLLPAEPATVQDVMGTDAYYAGSYFQTR